MRKTKYFLMMTLILGCITYSSPVVNAADPYLDCGSKTGRVTVNNKVGEFSPNWAILANNSIASWNNSANVSITKQSSSTNVLEASRYNDTWYGEATQYHNKGNTTKFIIKVNARTIENDATNTSNFVMSTITHEFGHIFRLCDNPNTSMASIMKYSRNRNTMTGPQQFDIRNVNNVYK